MSVTNKEAAFSAWFDAFAEQCGHYLVMHELTDLSKSTQTIAQLESEMTSELPNGGVFQAAVDPSNGYKPKISATDTEGSNKNLKLFKDARNAFAAVVGVEVKSPGDVTAASFQDGTALSQYRGAAVGDFDALKNASINDFGRALMEGKNIGACKAFDSKAEEGEGPYYVAQCHNFFGKPTGVDPLLFNVVMSTLFVDELRTDGLSGPFTPSGGATDTWYVRKPTIGAPIVAAFYTLPEKDDEYTMSPLPQEELDDDYSFHPQAIAPYKKSTKGGNIDLTSPLISKVKDSFPTGDVPWGEKVLGVSYSAKRAKGADTPEKIPDLHDSYNKGYGAARPDLLYIDAVSLMDAYRAILVRIGSTAGQAAYKTKAKEIILALNNDNNSLPKEKIQVPGVAGTPGNPQPAPPQNVGKTALNPGEIHAYDVQCYLLENIASLATARERASYKRVGKISSAMPGNIVSRIHHGIALDSETGGNRWPPEGTGPNSEAYWLQNMCPDLWAMMTPHIELFRADYKKDDKGHLSEMGEKRIPFSNFVDPSDIEQITSQRYGRLGGAGIKSFTWSLDGVQPAEVDNVISANLTMHFQSVYDLFRHNEIHDNNGNPTGEYAAGQPTAGYLDLIIGSGTTVTQKEREDLAIDQEDPSEKPNPFASPCGVSGEIYEGAAYRIKAVVGWATPPNFLELNIPGYNTSQLESIKRAVDSSRKALYLQIVSHAINFAQDGTLELAIQYQASLSGIARSPDADIFIAKELHSEELKSLEEEYSNLPHKTDVDTFKTLPKNEQDSHTAREKEILEEQLALMQRNRLNKYSVFLNMLSEKSKMYGVRVPRQRLLNPLGSMSPEDRAKAAKQRQSENIAGTVLSDADTYTKGDKSMDEFVRISSLVASTAGDDEAHDAAKSDADRILEDMSRNVGIFDTGNQDTTLIPFFYLGDLIDILFDQRLAHLVETQGKTTPLQMLLGTVEMVDPLRAYQVESVKFDCGNGKTGVKRIAELDPLRFRKVTGITQYMNIGSIPISLDAFNDWFMTNVINTNKDSYFLLNFIKDVCAGLISAAYGDVCFKGLFNFNVRFDTATFRLADRFGGKTNVTLEQLGKSSRRAQKRDVLRQRADSTHSPSIPTLVVYSVDSRPNVGDRHSDMSEGIYHYFLGGRCGLAKSINFNRQDMPFYREARISKDGSLGAQQLKELYTVDLSMIGNGLQKNGTFVYIDPIAIGAGSARAIGGIPNIARLIGLGGYFLVTKVGHEVSTSGYETSVNAIQQMSAFDMTMNESISNINYYGSPVAEDPPPDEGPTGGDDDADEGEESGDPFESIAGDTTGVTDDGPALTPRAVAERKLAAWEDLEEYHALDDEAAREELETAQLERKAYQGAGVAPRDTPEAVAEKLDAMGAVRPPAGVAASAPPPGWNYLWNSRLGRAVWYPDGPSPSVAGPGPEEL